MLDNTKLKSTAANFKLLNEAGNLVLPNAWDAASARVFEEAGFPAIGTTSAGIAYAYGLRDGQRIGRDAMLARIASIAASVKIPVSADIEAGYGSEPGDIAETVHGTIDAGAVGINLEDNAHGSLTGPLFPIADQQARVAAARKAAEGRGVPIVINARTDTFLLQLGSDLDERVKMTIDRGRAYLAAGADLVFIPLVIDPAIVRRLAEGIGGPISLMAMPGAPAAHVLFEAGAKRVSIGQTAMLATLGALNEIATEMRNEGTWRGIEKSFYGFAETEALFIPK